MKSVWCWVETEEIKLIGSKVEVAFSWSSQILLKNGNISISIFCHFCTLFKCKCKCMISVPHHRVNYSLKQRDFFKKEKKKGFGKAKTSKCFFAIILQVKCKVTASAENNIYFEEQHWLSLHENKTTSQITSYVFHGRKCHMQVLKWVNK